MRVLVIGGGPAGATAARQARALGADVTLVEAKRLGGTSLNEGPAPIRTLARAARLLRDSRSWGRFGLRGDPPQVDIAAALANAKRVANYAHEQKRLAEVVRGQGVDLVEGVGPARFVDPYTVQIPDGQTFDGDAVVVAVGGHPGRLPIPGAELALTYDDLAGLTALPASVAVVGGADTGCQLASILADFGAQVTLVEASPRLVPHADQDVSTALADSFRRRGIAAAAAVTQRARQHKEARTMSIALPVFTPIEETLYLTLCGRALDHHLAQPILGDPMAEQVVGELGYDCGRFRLSASPILNIALRAKKLDQVARGSSPATRTPSGSTWGPGWTPGCSGSPRPRRSTGTTSTSPRSSPPASSCSRIAPTPTAWAPT
jgi:thioredoxin reductase